MGGSLPCSGTSSRHSSACSREGKEALARWAGASRRAGSSWGPARLRACLVARPPARWSASSPTCPWCGRRRRLSSTTAPRPPPAAVRAARSAGWRARGGGALAAAAALQPQRRQLLSAAAPRATAAPSRGAGTCPARCKRRPCPPPVSACARCRRTPRSRARRRRHPPSGRWPTPPARWAAGGARSERAPRQRLCACHPDDRWARSAAGPGRQGPPLRLQRCRQRCTSGPAPRRRRTAGRPRRRSGRQGAIHAGRAAGCAAVGVARPEYPCIHARRPTSMHQSTAFMVRPRSVQSWRSGPGC
jgi:hypothetical protein